MLFYKHIYAYKSIFMRFKLSGKQVSMGIKKKFGFTLAEVLITLGIIGVVAALTIPALINNYRAVEMKTRFDKAYSVISQAFELMKIDNEGYVDGRNYSGQTFVPVFQRYFKTVQAGQVNYAKGLPTYRNFAGNANFNQYFLDDGTLRLADGILIFIENPFIYADTQYNAHVYIFADINGLKKPNMAGKDLFGFQVTDNKLIPMGANDNAIQKDSYFGNGTSGNDEDDWCNETSKSPYNGLSCTYKALNDKNYFKKIFKK